MGIAQFVKKIHERNKAVGGGAVLFRVDPPILYEEWNDDLEDRLKFYSNYLVASAVFIDRHPETYLFASDYKGEILNWTELDGSFRGSLDIPQALINAGYVIQ